MQKRNEKKIKSQSEKRPVTAFIEDIQHFVSDHELIPEGSRIVVGLSGGPDSVFLLHLLAALRDEEWIEEIIAAHLDHEWRDDSVEDGAFCAALAEEYEVPFISAKLSDLPQTKWNGSQEEIGRAARRMFLESVMQENNADFIALAHHLQDQQETFFIRLLRGTSLAGLCAMWPKNGAYIRPLLQTNKEDIIRFLHTYDIPYVVDPSNESPQFLRNRIRATVLPALEQCDNRFNASFLNTLTRLQETEFFLNQLAETLLEQMSVLENGTLVLELEPFLILNPVIQQRILINWLKKAEASFPVTQSFLDEMLRFLAQPEGKTHEIHPEWKIVKKQSKAWIVKL